MKGVILCGGCGTRLLPLTLTTNKHILPIYNKQMVCYPLKTLKDMGITDICVVLGGENVDAFIRFLKDGSQFGLKFTYIYQREAGGIAQAVLLCEEFVGGDNFITILGDNLFIGSLAQFRAEFERSGSLCGLVFYSVSNPCMYGVPRFDGVSVVEIVEKPQNPPSDYAVTGIYAYSPAIFDVIRKLTPSSRGELEISDAHTYILQEGQEVYYTTFEGIWCDCGCSFDSLLRSSLTVKSAITEKTHDEESDSIADLSHLISYLPTHPSVALTNHSIESLRFITGLLPPANYPHLLDIGCADGNEAKALQGMGYEVVGITLGEVNVKYAHEHYADVEVREMDMHNLDFANGSFDAIYMNHTYEHALAPFEVLHELYAVLKPEGRLWISMPDYIVEGEEGYDSELSVISNHHPNMLPPEVHRRYFRLFFEILPLSDQDTTRNCYLLKPKPFASLHSDIQSRLRLRGENER